MKHLQIILAIGIAIFAGCGSDNTSLETRSELSTFPIGDWRATNQYFSATVEADNPQLLEKVKEHERETSEDVSEEKAYKLSFEEKGLGSGSGMMPDGTGRYTFNLRWMMEDGALGITGKFYVYKMNWETGELVLGADEDKIMWEIEEWSADRMVLMCRFVFSAGDTKNGHWIETHTYRYTFEREK